jgi:UDP-N-acetylglucosamine acyltransferase
VQDRAFISGNCLVHQFVRVGTLAMMQGGAAISKDLPPYTVARGRNGMSGLNTVGLRRAGFTVEDRQELKQVYRLVFRGRRRFSEGLDEAVAAARSGPSRVFLEFVKEGKRGFCSDSGSSVAEEEDA